MSSHTSLASLAWRNVWRNRRRTLITLFGIAFGLFLSIMFTGIGDSTYKDMVDYGAKMGGGHVGIQHESQTDNPSLKHTVSNAEQLRADASALPGVELAVERISGAAMLSTASNSTGAFFIAVDPTQETKDSLIFAEHIVAGEMFEADDPKGVVIGATIAENLEVEVGKKMVLTLTDKEGEIITVLVRVRGIVKTGAVSIDGGLCLLPIEAIRKHLGYGPHEATQVSVFLADHRRGPQVRAALQSKLGEHEVALTWEQLQPDLKGMIDMKQGSTWIMEGIIMALLAAGIFNTLFVSVMERLREFGILRAIGFRTGQLFGLVMWESLWIALAGLVAAALLSAWPYYALSTTGLDYSQLLDGATEVAGVALLEPRLYVRIYPEHLLQLCMLVVASTLAAGLYPAWRAGRVPPAEAIRQN